jgi:thiamine biosynthesis lipoprotein
MRFVTKSKECLGTVVEIKLPQSQSSFFSDCFFELERIEKTYSRFLPTSQLSKVNSKLHTWQKVSTEFILLVEKSLSFAKQTNGAFDITLKSRLENLGYDASYSFQPKVESVVLRLKNFFLQFQRPILINKQESTIYLRKQIEFGGLGKGFALDCLAKIIREKGVLDFYINAGGDIYGGCSEKSKPWTILLEHPDDATRAIGYIELKNQAIACSAPNRRKWGKHHHLLNSQTGQSEHSLKCIFVLAKTGIEADAYATALFTSGFERAIPLSHKLPVCVFLVSAQNKVYRNSDFLLRNV